MLKEAGTLGARLSTLWTMVFAAATRGAVFHCVALPAAIALVANVPSKQATAMCVRRRRVKRSFGEETAASVPAPHRQKPWGALASRPSEGGLRWRWSLAGGHPSDRTRQRDAVVPERGRCKRGRSGRSPERALAFLFAAVARRVLQPIGGASRSCCSPPCGRWSKRHALASKPPRSNSTILFSARTSLSVRPEGSASGFQQVAERFRPRSDRFGRYRVTHKAHPRR